MTSGGNQAEATAMEEKGSSNQVKSEKKGKEADFGAT